MKTLWGLLVFTLLIFNTVHAQNADTRYYNIGSPVLTEIWVDPVNGSDDNTGESRDQALLSVNAAWGRIPMGETLTSTGYHILLLSGTFSGDFVPVYWESRYGTFEFPIIIEAADGPGTVTLPSLNLFEGRYLYLIGLSIVADGGDVLHCERCDHLLIRDVRIVGAEPDTYNVQETLKINQSQYVYVEDSDISGAWDNAVDFVGVQYGHFQGNRIHNAGDWCMYLKGGSAYFRVESNEYFDCGTGGFTAGQGTGFQFMTAPWIQYEAYDIQFVNNVIHDTQGAGMGVQGGYNILMAYNTLYRMGMNSHVLEFGFGSRSCDGQPGDERRENCDSFLASGGWGNIIEADGSNYVRIPNRNVYVYNNILYNPAGYQSQWQQFFIPAATSDATQDGANVPVPTLADDNLQIRGNVIWNGPAEHPLGIESDAGCQPDNPTCNMRQLLADNAINTIEPHLVDPEAGDYHPVGLTATTYPIADFPGSDRPNGVPESSLTLDVLMRDFDGHVRGEDDVPGAFAL